ncbi:MAG TPA: MBL fold metallo-hydrolase [Opitutaceae bacterium]|nr:MBL fold metallo-hydrolase [Opitutaceae bacterium]
MNRRHFLLSSGALATAGFLGRAPLSAQTPPPAPAPAPGAPPVRPPVATEFTPLRRNVGLFTGRGGSIGWLSNGDALACVDTQFADTAEIFLRDLPGRGGRALDVIVNTHHHGDHTGGNAALRPSAKSIVAHANVPALLAARAEADKAVLNPATVPDTTFPETWRMTLGDEVVSARHFGPAHTRGDIVVLFERANVVHMGDLMFNRLYPVIDRPGGASIRGWIGVLEKVAATYPADARFIFGHGQPKFGVLGGPAELLVFRDYLAGLLAHVERELKAGRSKEDVQKLENLPGFPDFHVPPGRGNRLPVNLGVAYEELSAG